MIGVRTSNKIPIKNKVGKILLNEEDQTKRWIEYFKEALNRPIPNNTYDLSEETLTTLNIRIDKIKTTEVTAAIKCLKNNKTGGTNGIPVEFMKYSKNGLIKWVAGFFNDLAERRGAGRVDKESDSEAVQKW